MPLKLANCVTARKLLPVPVGSLWITELSAKIRYFLDDAEQNIVIYQFLISLTVSFKISHLTLKRCNFANEIMASPPITAAQKGHRPFRILFFAF